MDKYSILIGISGGTGSGKTSFSRAICSNCPPSNVALIEQDAYYKDLSNLSLEEREKNNYDHPNSLDFYLLKKQLNKLIYGKVVNIPKYDYKKHIRLKEVRRLEKHKIIILEGILALYDHDIRNMMDIKIFIETDDDIRLIRRIQRDVENRDRKLSSIINQYCKTVRPMHNKFVEPTKKYADIIIPNGGKNKTAIDIVQSRIFQLLDNNFKN